MHYNKQYNAAITKLQDKKEKKRKKRKQQKNTRAEQCAVKT